MKRHHVIYNQDCTNLFGITRGVPITPAHVDRMVDEVADGGADLMLINPNAQRVCYPSRVWQTFWDGYADPGTPQGKAFFGAVAESEIPGRQSLVLQMKSLADQGCDYLTRALARCRHKGITPGVTVRMNDMHDANAPGTHLFNHFYMQHPEFWLDNGEFSGWSARGLDYRRPEVHAYFLKLIRELVFEYDTDVVELDFLRFHSYFPRTLDPSHARIMTGFVRQVRDLLAGAPRPVALTARVPATPGSALELGFDVASWAREKLVDAITPGAFLTTQWSIPVEAFRALVGKDVAVYACTDYAADRRPNLPMRHISTSPEMLRAFAAGSLASGADGVELFNFFCAREVAWGGTPVDPSFHALREMHALDGLRGKPKRYLLSVGSSNAEVDGPFQLPQNMDYGAERRFEFRLASEQAGAEVELDVTFSGGTAASTRWCLQFNNQPVGFASRVSPLSDDASGKAHTATFAVPASAIVDGKNLVSLRNENPAGPLLVVAMDVRVGC